MRTVCYIRKMHESDPTTQAYTGNGGGVDRTQYVTCRYSKTMHVFLSPPLFGGGMGWEL